MSVFFSDISSIYFTHKGPEDSEFVKTLISRGLNPYVALYNSKYTNNKKYHSCINYLPDLKYCSKVGCSVFKIYRPFYFKARKNQMNRKNETDYPSSKDFYFLISADSNCKNCPDSCLDSIDKFRIDDVF